MTLFSEYFEINKTQAELDFVDIDLDRDFPLFVDPFAISQRKEMWCQECHQTIITFFQIIIEDIRSGDNAHAIELLKFLREPNEIRFGFSKNRPKGSGIGPFQANQLLHALQDSSAVRTGFINSLEETEIMVEGIGHDKISDLTTNIIRWNLVDYTNEQCKLFNIPVQSVALAPYFCKESKRWINDYYQLPLIENKPVLLVPKVIARYSMAYDHRKYYKNFAIEFLQAEELNAKSSLVKTLKNGTLRVYKKDLEAHFRCTKENLFIFSKKHPEVLKAYRNQLIRLENQNTVSQVSQQDEIVIAGLLSKALRSIPAGNKSASEYHNLMIGILEFLFFPNLLYPRKENEIHDGRKRIDIVMENGAIDGIFHRLHDVRHIPCQYVVIECKNYSTDVNNPELDQLSGRFSTNRGRVGFLCSRHFDNRGLFIDRCRDTFKDDRGLIIPFEDNDLTEMLHYIENGERNLIDEHIRKIIDEICLN